jgi:predicted chitinase
MIISPPFLPDRAAHTEEAWLDAAMAQPASRLKDTRAAEGSFPLSLGLAWHNGIHIQSPPVGGGHLPVHAVADGKVVFVHRQTEPNADIDHPLNYNPFGDDAAPTAAWTSDGFIVIEHSTEIGASGDTPTTVVYYSACMHLGSIAHNPRTRAPWAEDDRIYRKETLGAAGRIYGDAGQIHFEICCDPDNLLRLIGRGPDWADPLSPQAPTQDGRTDSVFGSLYVYLPEGAALSTSAPTSHLHAPDATTTLAPQWVQITYDKGSATLRSYDESGEPIGARDGQPEPDLEYNLYAEASRRHDSLGAAGREGSSPSGWFELLRFGRNLGPDPLPANAAHWRQIPAASGAVWADLNAPGSFKFSDADFLPVMGWNCFDDDSTPDDQRCDSLLMKTLIRDRDPGNERRMERDQLARRLGEQGVRAKLRRTLCMFPSEWDQGTIKARHGWLKAEIFDEAQPEKWKRFAKHLEAVSFAELPADFLKANWRFHPREFVGHMRRCGWLSSEELAQCIPRHCSLGTTHWQTALARGQDHHNAMSRMFRKYGASTAERKIHFLAQIFIETGLLRTVQEGGQGAPNRALPKAQYYSAFYGRGYMQLTWASNYDGYGKYRALPNHTTAYADVRISSSSTHVWSDFNSATQNPVRQQWHPRYDPDTLMADGYASADSGGYYWVSKTFRGTCNITRVADLGLEPRYTGFVSWLVNGGGNGYSERYQFARYLSNILEDEPRHLDNETWDYPPLNRQLTATFPPGNPSCTKSVQINYAPQIP